MEAWDGGAPRVVADYAEAFGLQNLDPVYSKKEGRLTGLVTFCIETVF